MAFSQEADWKLNILNFINNTEFGGSAVKIPQTMGGLIVSPEVGITWDSVHRVSIGVNLLHEYGSRNAVDKVFPIAYYQYHKDYLRFNMGAFPREMALGNYPRLFFQDSVSYYRPNINGGLLEYRRNADYANLWLDWTGRQSQTVNEAYFFGLSGRLNRGIFYFEHFNYVFHYAGSLDTAIDEPLHDVGFFLTSAGIDLSKGTIFSKLDINGGWVYELDRSREEHTGWIKSNGFLSEARIQYKWFGIFNTFYRGDALMFFYNSYGNKLYWGDPVYRVKTYDRMDFYVIFLQNKKIDLDFTFTWHFLEDNVYLEQLLRVNVNLNFFKK
jgi:hypothetical protein